MWNRAKLRTIQTCSLHNYTGTQPCPLCQPPRMMLSVPAEKLERLEAIERAAAAILRPARGDAPWMHTAEFDDLRAALGGEVTDGK